MDNLDPEFERRFSEAHHSRTPRLLKLCVLRDLVHELHRQKSRYLASPDAQAQALPLERALRALEHAQIWSLKEDSISKLLSGRLSRGEQEEPRRRFLKVLANSRFSRLDRKWERSLLVEGLSRGWTLGTLTRALPHAEVQGFHEELGRSLWPDGVTLFVESAHPSQAGLWNGRWWLLTRKADPGISGFRPIFDQKTP